ncbi:metallophosphoesterase [Gracilibacillus dipsosauri]|uniref:Metallophosphoesterase n=1 Tax=Gracilibacillus dipsosauri TaxID=178340 RepID=A0A317KYM8_9BACI|nr:metallophosphoesterase [Gracilibacillus dipsosauri]PWU68453.1 metallophosphoesterase [Gracilibacillus dipsosauri]
MKKILAGLVIGGLLIKSYYDTNVWKINRLSIGTDRLKDETFRLVQLTDIHNKIFFNQYTRLLQKIINFHPDLIVLTGDLIDRKTKDFSGILAFVEQLAKSHQYVYFVSGNHEWDHPRGEEFINSLRQRNVKLLDNKRVIVKLKRCQICLVGVADAATGNDQLTESLFIKEGYRILLSHSPEIINRKAAKLADLILCGHTHGGQIRLPFLGAIISPDQGLFPSLDKGIFQHEKGKYLYIDSGLGTTRLPIRFLNQSQLSFLTIYGTNR